MQVTVHTNNQTNQTVSNVCEVRWEQHHVVVRTWDDSRHEWRRQNVVSVDQHDEEGNVTQTSRTN